MMPIVARCRAEENRVFVACAAAPTANGATMIVDPGGRVARAGARRSRRWPFRREVNRALAHIKQRAPGTDIVKHRQPATYGAITRIAVPAASPA